MAGDRKALSDIENVPVEAIKAFYRRYYNPGNAILSVVGNLDSEDVFALAENGSLASRARKCRSVHSLASRLNCRRG